MLAVIGPRWLVARGPDGRNALDNEQDWIRRELLAAKEYGVRVIPVLVGEHTVRLDSAALPPALSWLADVQYRRFNNRDADAGLATIAGDLVAFVPGLTDRTTTATGESGRPDINTTA
ncbi:MAG TPA: TIR domain-containing protein, partial [Pseudonocardiaceae bacterium]|nr:TIR domain-containing protein [Pseudonocardiaceae bacterium]